MSSPAIHLSDAQEQELRNVDHEVDQVMRELDRWLRGGPAARLASAAMSDEERAAYNATRARLRQLNDEREALRVQLFAERTQEIRRQHLAAMVTDQEAGRAAARAASERRSSEHGIVGLFERLFGKR